MDSMDARYPADEWKTIAEEMRGDRVAIPQRRQHRMPCSRSDGEAYLTYTTHAHTLVNEVNPTHSKHLSSLKQEAKVLEWRKGSRCDCCRLIDRVSVKQLVRTSAFRPTPRVTLASLFRCFEFFGVVQAVRTLASHNNSGLFRTNHGTICIVKETLGSMSALASENSQRAYSSTPLGTYRAVKSYRSRSCRRTTLKRNLQQCFKVVAS